MLGQAPSGHLVGRWWHRCPSLLLPVMVLGHSGGVPRRGVSRAGAGGSPLQPPPPPLPSPSSFVSRSGDASAAFHAKINSLGALGRRLGGGGGRGEKFFPHHPFGGLIAGDVTLARWISLPNGCGRGQEDPSSQPFCSPKLAPGATGESSAALSRLDLFDLFIYFYFPPPPPSQPVSPHAPNLTAPGN